MKKFLSSTQNILLTVCFAAVAIGCIVFGYQDQEPAGYVLAPIIIAIYIVVVILSNKQSK